MQLHAARPDQVREGLHLGRRIDGAEFGGIGEGDALGLRVMLAADEALQRLLHHGRRDLAAGRIEPDDLGAAGEELRRIAFIDRDMRFRMADDGAEARRDGRQRQARWPPFRCVTRKARSSQPKTSFSISSAFFV